MIQAGSASIPGADVRSRIDEILARGEFGGRQGAFGKWLREKLEGILDAIGELFGISPRVVGDALVVFAYVALAAALVWIVWRIVRSRRTPVVEGNVEPVIDPVEARKVRVADLLKSARAARAAGDLVLSLRLYFTALVVGLGEKGDLEYRDAWTNRELLERGEPSERVERALSPLVRDLDAKSFGGAVAVEADVDAMSRVVDELLGAQRR